MVRRGDLPLVEGEVVGVGLDFPREFDFQAPVRILLACQPPQAVTHPRADDDQMVAAEAADHVEIQHQGQAFRGQRRMVEPIAGAHEPFFFGVPESEKHAALGALAEKGQRPGQHQHAGSAAGIVVGAVVNIADGAEAVVAMAVADVIVVRADQDHLVLELGIAALRPSPAGCGSRCRNPGRSCRRRRLSRADTRASGSAGNRPPPARRGCPPRGLRRRRRPGRRRWPPGRRRSTIPAPPHATGVFLPPGRTIESIGRGRRRGSERGDASRRLNMDGPLEDNRGMAVFMILPGGQYNVPGRGAFAPIFAASRL